MARPRKDTIRVDLMLRPEQRDWLATMGGGHRGAVSGYAQELIDRAMAAGGDVIAGYRAQVADLEAQRDTLQKRLDQVGRLAST